MYHSNDEEFLQRTKNEQTNLIGKLVVRDDIGVPYIDGAIRQDRAQERANDALRLVRSPHVAIADIEDN